MMDVPLVVYSDGERNVVGEAVVHDDGSFEGKITSEEMSLERVLETSMVFGTSLDMFRMERKWTEQSESLF